MYEIFLGAKFWGGGHVPPWPLQAPLVLTIQLNQISEPSPIPMKSLKLEPKT